MAPAKSKSTNPRDLLTSDDEATRMAAARDLAPWVGEHEPDENVPAPLYPTDEDVAAGRVAAGE